MSDTFLTIAAPSEGLYKEKMSKFLAFAYPVATEPEAREIIASLQRKYHDARHVCWAFVLGADRLRSLSTDNGEPSGTAGRPILGQINSLSLTNVLVVVVRYFGGIKLGTSGLIVAYREAAREALTAAQIVERNETDDLTFTFPYISMNEVMRLTKGDDVTVIDRQFDNSCQMTVRIRRDLSNSFKSNLSEISGLTFK